MAGYFGALYDVPKKKEKNFLGPINIQIHDNKYQHIITDIVLKTIILIMSRILILLVESYIGIICKRMAGAKAQVVWM